LRRVLLDVLRPDRRQELLPLLLHSHAVQVVRVQPVLQTRQVVRGPRRAWPSGLDRKVVVDTVARVTRLLHDDRRESEDRQCESRCEHEVDDRDRQPAREAHPREGPYERVEEQGEQQRQARELHPPRNDQPRLNRLSRHENHRIAGSGDPFSEGSLALDLWFDPPPPRLKAPRSFDTVAPDMPSSRPTRRRRVERREVRAARRARRFALLTILAIVLVIALALVAFGGGTARIQKVSVTNTLLAAQADPYPQIVALHGAVRIQMPVVQSAATAIGYHSASDTAITLKPLGHQG